MVSLQERARLPSPDGFHPQGQSITRSKYHMKRSWQAACCSLVASWTEAWHVQHGGNTHAMLRSARKARLPPIRMANNTALSHWLNTSSLLSLPRRTAWRAIVWLLAQRGMTPAPAVENSYRADDLRLIRKV